MSLRRDIIAERIRSIRPRGETDETSCASDCILNTQPSPLNTVNGREGALYRVGAGRSTVSLMEIDSGRIRGLDGHRGACLTGD